MAENDKILTLFTTRVRQLILQYNAQRDCQSLKMAKMMEISDGDIEMSKRRIASLIREVNKCITLLSGQ